MDVRLELSRASSDGADAFVTQLTEESTKIEQQITDLQSSMRVLEEQLAEYDSGDQRRRQIFAETERQIRLLQDEAGKLRDSESLFSVEKARFDTQAESVVAEVNAIFGPEVGAEVLRTASLSTNQNLDEAIAKLRHQLELIGGVDEMTMQEYRETEERFTRLSEQIADLKRSMEDLRQVMDELDEHIKSRFNEAFHKINEKFENYFRMLFNGGRAQLVLVRADDERQEDAESVQGDSEPGGTLRPEEKIIQKYEGGVSNIVGVDMKATPPGKKLANIQALSGGERALTSIALLCALLACFPSPFVVLDEVDAALDEANTIRFGQILGTLAHQTQFVTITHNRETMAQSTMLYGVTMGDDSVSKILSLKFDQAAAYAK
jgi:chromosome segregation protein